MSNIKKQKDQKKDQMVTIHGTNESDLHIHFAVSTINFRSGLKWHDSKTDLDLRDALFNKILGKYQYMFIVNK